MHPAIDTAFTYRDATHPCWALVKDVSTMLDALPALADAPWSIESPGCVHRTHADGPTTYREHIVFCQDCYGTWPQFFMVRDALWQAHAANAHILCLDCFSKRVGRPLTLTDLKGHEGWARAALAVNAILQIKALPCGPALPLSLRPAVPYPEVTARYDPRDSRRTAIRRTKLSRPYALALRQNALQGMTSLLDYGCGRGDDMRNLEAYSLDRSAVLGGTPLDIRGWDPYWSWTHRHATNPEAADFVGLVYVLNVIADPIERIQTLRSAWALAKKRLLVAVRTCRTRGKPHGDGVLTTAGTFQRTYTHAQIMALVRVTTGVEPESLGSGVCIVTRPEPPHVADPTPPRAGEEQT